MPTGLALLRAQKEERDMLGRWKPDRSDTCIRMYNGVIARLQQQLAKSVRGAERHKELDERDIIESAMSWLSKRGVKTFRRKALIAFFNILRNHWPHRFLQTGQK